METATRLHLIDVASGIAKLWGMIPRDTTSETFDHLILRLKTASKPEGPEAGKITGWGQRFDHETGFHELALFRLFPGGEVLCVFDVHAHNKGRYEALRLWASGKTFSTSPASRFLTVWWELKEGRISGANLNGAIPKPEMVKPELDCITEILEMFPALDDILLEVAAKETAHPSPIYWTHLVSDLIHDRIPYPHR